MQNIISLGYKLHTLYDNIMLYTIRNKNGAGEYHGYQQWHRLNTLALRGNCCNDTYTGYVEYHCYEIRTIYYIQ